MSKHIVIDNIIPESLQNRLLEDITLHEWTYRGSTNLDTDDHIINDTTYDVGQLSSGIIYTGYRNDYVDVLQPLINIIENHLGKILLPRKHKLIIINQRFNQLVTQKRSKRKN